MISKDNRIVNTFEGGMALDFPESLQPKNTYRYARNAVLADRESFGISISNEESNIQADIVGAPVVGHFFVERLNTTFLFVKGDILGYFDHDKEQYKEIARASEFGCVWGFNECEWISAEYKTMQPCDELYVYFSSNCTYYRINITELLSPVRKENIKKSILEGNKKKINCDYSCEYFKLFHCVCTPKITNDVNERGGHKLEAGAYKFAIQLEDKEGNTTNWSEVSQPIYIGSDSNQPGEITQASINVHLTGLDCRYDVANIAVINGVGSAKVVASVPYTTNGVTFTYYGQEGRAISLEEIIVKGKKYFRGRSLAQKDGRLYLYNIRQEKNPNMQRRVFETARLQFITIQTDVKTAERYNLKSLQRGENYMFGVVYKYCDGTHSPVFLMSPQASGGENCNKTNYKFYEPKPPTGEGEKIERVSVNTRTGIILPDEPQGLNPSDNPINLTPPTSYEEVDPITDFGSWTTNFSNWENSAKCNDCHPPICCQTDEEGNVTPVIVPGFGDNCAGCSEDENAIANDGPDFENIETKIIDKWVEWGNGGQNNPNSSNLIDAAKNLIDYTNKSSSLKRTAGKYFINIGDQPPGDNEPNDPTENIGNSIPVSEPEIEDPLVLTPDDVNNIVGDEFGETTETASRPPSEAPSEGSFILPPNNFSKLIPWGDEVHNLSGNPDLDNNIKIIECWDPDMGVTTTLLYPDTKDCDGLPIYGTLENKNVKLFTTPTLVESPAVEATGNGVPCKYTPTADPYSMVKIRLLGIQVTGVPLPTNDENWFPKPLCPNEPFRIVMVERSQINSTVQANCIATSTFVGVSGNVEHYFPRNGACSRDISDIHVWNNGNHLGDENLSEQSTVYNLHSLDTGLKAVGLSASYLTVNAKVIGTGYRYGLYSKGEEPNDRLNGNRIDQRGARQFINLNLIYNNITPPKDPDKYSNIKNIKGISYIDADTKRISVTGIDRPIVNGYRESSVVVGVDTRIDFLNDPYDASFKMDTLEHESIIWKAHAWNVSLKRDVPDQYGGVVGMKFIDTGVRANGRYDSNGAQINSVKGICGDVYIGPYTFVRKNFVSDKVGDVYRMDTPCNGRVTKTVCDSADDLLLQNLDINHYPTRLPKSGDRCDPRNYAGGYFPNTSLFFSLVNPFPTQDYYYPKVQKTLILTWLESRNNPWKRATGIGDQREAGQAYYPKLKGMFTDSNIVATHPWEESFLNRFYYRLDQPSPAQLLRKAIIRNLVEIAIPILLGLEATDKQQVTDITVFFAVLPALISSWKLFKDVVTREDYLNRMVGIQDCKTDAEGGEPDSNIVQFEDNYHLYNQQYSVTTNENYYRTMPLNYNTCVCDSCTDLQTTNEIYFSAKQQLGMSTDAYKNFKSFAYGEVGADKGKIRKLFKWDRNFYAHTTEGIFLIKYDAVTNQTSKGLQLLGIGEMVVDSSPLLEGVCEGIFGLQDPNASITTPFGYFFIDREAKRVYKFAGNAPEEISARGMYNFFKDNVDFCKTLSCHDEKNEGSTYYSMGWDNRYNRLLITKKSQEDGESFTISYYPLLGQGGKWGSFHDYIPQSYIWDRDKLFSISAGRIYKHNIKDKYQRFYGAEAPFEVQFVANLQDYEWFTYIDSEIHTQAEKDEVKGIDITFDKVAAWNFTQGTGTQSFKLLGDNKDTVINPAERIQETSSMPLSMARRRYTFNGIKDQRIPGCGHKPLVLIDECKYYPRINESIFDCSSAKDSEYIGHTIKDDHLNYRLTYDGKDQDVKLRLLKFTTTVRRDTI